MNPSYDEKKRKKSRIAIGDFFQCPLPIVLALDVLNAANPAARLSTSLGVTTQYYCMPTSDFQIAGTSSGFKGRLSARADAAHGTGGNVLFSWSSYREHLCMTAFRGPLHTHAILREPEWTPAADARSKWISSVAWC
ncbi:hypothetical protein [Paraburkholderia caffeinilytica]|uniref:hypothetical protein n=1 Tax=Paraburkholderia caffeinilytica TaxID=1761016 RepID=UPI0038BB2A31